jgi:GT2 family glycosyltransferase
VCTIVLNWNGWRDTAACLASLQRLRYDNNHVLVVDNGSTDDSVSHLREQFPSIEIIETEYNLGFAAGCNVGIRHPRAQNAEFLWLLNSDTVVEQNALQPMLEKAGDPTVGAVGSALYFMDHPDRLQAWGGGHVNFWLGRSRHFLEPVPDQKIDYITGASLLLRRSALESVGLLDEHFFFFWEDADLGFRLRKLQWKLRVAGDSKVWHKQSASLRGKTAVMDALFNCSARRFFRKHARIPQWPIYIGTALRVMKRLLSGDIVRARAVWRARAPKESQASRQITKPRPSTLIPEQRNVE